MNTVDKRPTLGLETDEIDLLRFLNQLWSKKWLVLTMTLAGLVCGALSILWTTPQYRSDVLLQIDQTESASKGLVADLASGMGGAVSNSTAAQIALIQSRFILDSVVQLLNLNIDVHPKATSFWEKIHSTWQTKRAVTINTFDVPKHNVNEVFELLLDKPQHVLLLNLKNQVILQGPIGVLITDKTRKIRLKIDKVSAPIGAKFSLKKLSQASATQGLMNKLGVVELGGKKNQTTGIFDLSLVGPNPKKLVDALNVIAKIATEKDAEKKSQEASQTLNFLYKQLPITKGDLERAELGLNQYRAKSGKINIRIQTEFLLHQLEDLDKTLNELHIKKLEMLQHYTVHHPNLIALQTQMNAMDINRSQLEKALKTLPASDQIAINLLRDVNVKKHLYLILLNKIQELQVVKAGTVSGIRVLSEAKMPDAALPNRNWLVYAGSAFMGLLLSIVCIFGRRWLFPRVEDPHWCERRFNLTNLAVIPFCKEQALTAASMDSSKQMPLAAHIYPRSLFVESLRSLRTSLQVSLLATESKVVSIMGISPNVGKSFISANLAYLLASAGKRVLLLDADLRRGTLHKYLNIPCSPGLAEVLQNTVSIEDALNKSDIENLTCLPRGVYPSAPSELLMGAGFKSLIQTLSEQFDIIIIDTAPVLLVTDAVIVGGVSGTNYLVFGAGAHQPAEIEVALKRLLSAGVVLQGSIYNFHHVQSRKASYGQYYYYSNYNYYEDPVKAMTTE